VSAPTLHPSTAAAFSPTAVPRDGGRPVLTEVVDTSTLRPVAERLPLRPYLAVLWQRRHFIVADARARVLSGARGTLLGTGWLVLRPVLDGAVYFLIFGLLLHSSRGIENFLGYLLIGVFYFGFTTRCLTSGAQSLVAGKQLVRSFSFPRAALPVAMVTRETLSFIPVLGTMLVLLLVIPPVETITWRWALMPVIVVLQLGLNMGLAFFCARATARIPDLQHVIGFATRFWLYGSAVFFAFDRFIDHPTLLAVVQLNPMFVVLDMTRDCLLYGVTPDLSSWLLLLGWSTVLLVGGFVWFWRGEERYGRA
jgi:teichoic acid transport system permease protein